MWRGRGDGERIGGEVRENGDGFRYQTVHAGLVEGRAW